MVLEPELLDKHTKKTDPGSHDKMAEHENREDGGSLEPCRLPELLQRGWSTLEEVERTDEPLASTGLQARVKRGLGLLEEASSRLALLDLFSRNEGLEELATADLKYLLLPALLGALGLKQTGRERRLQVVRAARAHFMGFLKRCKDYDVSPFNLPRDRADTGSPEEASAAQPKPCAPDLVSMAAQRQAKIERYRQRKELEARLSDVREAVESGQADDEVSRDFYLLNVRRWVTVCLEEIESIDQEVEILEKMDGLKQHAANQPAQPARPPMKPFILTKDAVQAKVFGAGYPSLATMTVDDWYEQHRKRGAMPDQGIPSRVVVDEDVDAKEREEEDKEKKAENDDEESLLRARNWDVWKDTHRRGYGNRHNMG
ncbi:immunoglobulin-binding protein 1 [Anoplopoma fimbria]|uniref:immunoglobulin-binding protein 1 n=1 Tax=Anoplopoma fimbria TaxID=229290 RepID=UPI0023EBDECF|nr:immunoglobulin-binding protein 1 [Anoplopoma fimbria]